MNTQEKMSDADIKKQHPEIKYKLEVEDAVCYLKAIDRASFEQSMGLIAKTRGNPEMLRAGEVILLNCWVTGDEIIKKDEELLMAACMQTFELLETKTATLKKI